MWITWTMIKMFMLSIWPFLTRLMGCSTPVDHNWWNANIRVNALFRARNVLRVKVNIEIHLFKGDLDPKALDEWIQKIESYYVVGQFSSQEIGCICYTRFFPKWTFLVRIFHSIERESTPTHNHMGRFQGSCETKVIPCMTPLW